MSIFHMYRVKYYSNYQYIQHKMQSKICQIYTCNQQVIKL